MKNHKVKPFDAFAGENSTDQPDRIGDTQLADCRNAICDVTGRIVKPGGFYPVTLADALGMVQTDPRTRFHTLVRQRGKDAKQRSLGIVGANLLRSTPNTIAEPWGVVTYPNDTIITPPALDQPSAIVFRNRYGYVSNLDDLPFRVKMEEDDGSTPSLVAEYLGLRPPLHPPKYSSGTKVDGTLYPPSSCTMFVVTFVYGDRGESGPSPPMYLLLTSSESWESFTLSSIPVGPTGVTARRVYRTRIGQGQAFNAGGAAGAYRSYYPLRQEFFFMAEIADNTTTTLVVGNTSTSTGEDNMLDTSSTGRVPPARPFPPRAKYMVIHQDRVVWGHLREHPWILGIQSDPLAAGVTSATLTISNSGNGTITITTNLGSTTITNYKTKTLKTILLNNTDMDWSSVGDFGGGDDYIMRVAPGVDWDRTYVFKEVTALDIEGDANVYWMEAIDGDAVLTDGCEYFRHRVMFSDITFPEQVNPFSSFDVNRDDAYPITGLFREDFTLGMMTQNDIWLLTGSFALNEDFVPDVQLNRTQSEHGNFCTRPDSIAQTPFGLMFIAQDGLRRFTGQTSEPFGHPIKKRLMARLSVEPRTRDNAFMHYESGILRIFFAGMEVA